MTFYLKKKKQLYFSENTQNHYIYMLFNMNFYREKKINNKKNNTGYSIVSIFTK